MKNKNSFKYSYLFFISMVLISLANNKIIAWVYPEHRDITVLAIESLDKTERAILNQLWNFAIIGHESRLPESIIDNTHGYIDYPSWAAIAGDHSCSPDIMLHTVLESDWIIEVSDIAAELKENLSKAKDHYQVINVLRGSDNQLQRADKKYATRANSNNVHFLLSLPQVGTTSDEYAKTCFASGADANIIAAYSYFHLSALSKISKINDENLNREEKSKIILSALADEAFAIHFIEDAFASGHVAGS